MYIEVHATTSAIDYSSLDVIIIITAKTKQHSTLHGPRAAGRGAYE